MKKRIVFSVDDIRQAQAAMGEARVAGIEDRDLSLVTSAEQQDLIPPERHAGALQGAISASKSAAMGTGVGLALGLFGVLDPMFAMPPVDLLFAAVLGGGIGGIFGLISARMLRPDPLPQFEPEVDDGRILVVIDGSPGALADAAVAVEATGARQLDPDEPSATSARVQHEAP